MHYPVDKPCPIAAGGEAPSAGSACGQLIQPLRVLARGWLVLALVPLLLAATTWGWSVMQPEEYEATATLLPRSQESSGFDGLAGSMFSGLPLELSLAGSSFPAELVAFLRSRSLEERLIRDHDLLPVLYPGEAPAPSVAYALDDRAIKERYQVEFDTENEVVRLTWRDEEPARAAAVLQSAIASVREFLHREFAAVALARRAFVEEQVAEAEAELTRLDKLTPTHAMSLDHIRRELMAAETVYAGLKRQLAVARLEEDRQLNRFTLLDPPHTPAKAVWPRPWLVSGLAWCASLFACAGVLLLRHGLAASGRPQEDGT